MLERAGRGGGRIPCLRFQHQMCDKSLTSCSYLLHELLNAKAPPPHSPYPPPPPPPTSPNEGCLVGLRDKYEEPCGLHAGYSIMLRIDLSVQFYNLLPNKNRVYSMSVNCIRSNREFQLYAIVARGLTTEFPTLIALVSVSTYCHSI